MNKHKAKTMIHTHKALRLVKGAFFALIIAVGCKGIYASEIPKPTEDLVPQTALHEKTSISEQKGEGLRKRWFKFEPLSPYTVKFPFPGGYVRVPLLKPSVMAAMGVGSLFSIPEPFNYMVGFPLIGLGSTIHYMPLCKTTLGKVVLGTSIGGAALSLTTVFVVISIAESVGRIYK